MQSNIQISNPNENIIIPTWINADYFKDILRKDEPESLSIKNFTPIAAIPPGENFTSVMLRIHMDLEMKDGTRKHKSYVLKTMLDDDKGGAIINKLTLFPKELDMYHKYLPAFEKLYNDKGWHIKFAPKCLFTEQKDGRINFVFEDLSQENFVNLDRLQGCDMMHMKSILKRLAEFHAASAVYEEQNGEFPEHFQMGFVDGKFGEEFQKKIFNAKMGDFKKAMKQWGLDDVDKYLENFPNCDQYWKCCASTLEQNSNKFNVLTHGDFWSSNIMFSYLSNGALNDLILLDFQICKWGSPAEDLLFFISISAAKDIRIKEFDNFIAIYYERLVECLKVLDYKKPLPKLRDLHKDMFDQKNTFYDQLSQENFGSNKMKTKTEIINPNEDLIIPSWIKVDYFKDILAKDEPNMLSIQNFRPIAAIPPGENFTSVLIRIHMDLVMKDGSSKHKTYILKTMIDDDKGGDVINKLALFPKEMEMYQKYLPAFENLYKSVGWNIQLAPKCWFTEKKDGRINFVFEDLKEKNYTNIDRLEGCDMLHMKHIMRRLAELHAASAVYEERNGEYPNDFQIGFVDLEAGADYQKNMFKTKMVSYKKAMQQWGLPEVDKYLKEFPSSEQYWKCCLSTLQQKTNNFNVLNHGDFWSSNVMFNYLPTGELNDLIFLDYQFCKWGSPAEDLLFFITVSANKDIRIKEFDHFIYIYHERLIECLKVLGFKKPLPKLRDLHKDMFDQKNSFYAFFACFNHLAAVLLPSDKDSSIHTFCRPDEIGEQFRMKAFTNPRYVEAMNELFPFFFKRGLFNFSDYD